MSRLIGVAGGGGFGQALAMAARRNGHDVRVLSRRKQEIEGAGAVTDARALAGCDLIFIAVPSGHVSDVAQALSEHVDGSHLLVHVSRGLIGPDLRTVSQVLRALTPARRVGALAGPLVADALAEGRPGGAVVGTRFPEVAEAVREAIGSQSLRVYDTEDLTGVEVASATVGLLALAAGYALGVGFGPSSLAVLLTRGMAEAGRIGEALGANLRTFNGLAGYGDLLAALAGDDRPELRLGQALGKGVNVATAGREVGAYVEGITVARQVADFAAGLGVDTPIAEVVAAVLEGKLTAEHAVEQLMSRRVQKE